MIHLLVELLLCLPAVWIAARLLPGVKMKGIGSALVLTVIFIVVSPILKSQLSAMGIVTEPFALHLMSLMVQSFLVVILANFLPGFTVQSMGWALGLCAILSTLRWVIALITGY